MKQRRYRVASVSRGHGSQDPRKDSAIRRQLWLTMAVFSRPAPYVSLKTCSWRLSLLLQHAGVILTS